MRPTKKKEQAVTESDHAAIARLAYELYQRRGGSPGHELEDWLQAEAIVLHRRGNGAPRRPVAASRAPAG